MMWMRVNAESGEIIERGLDTEPTPASGEEVYGEPRSSAAVWVPAERGWLFDEWATIRVQLGDDLPALRAARWEMVKALRDVAQSAGCHTLKGRVDSDAESRSMINGATTLAMLAQMQGSPFEIDWTMQDNSVEPHNADEMIALGVAVAQHVAACHAVALTKRSAIDDAADRLGIEAVNPSEGWPA